MPICYMPQAYSVTDLCGENLLKSRAVVADTTMTHAISSGLDKCYCLVTIAVIEQWRSDAVHKPNEQRDGSLTGELHSCSSRVISDYKL